MSHLHTVNSPEQFTACARFLTEGDALLLIEDGIYCATRTKLDNVDSSVSVYLLQDDLRARGMGNMVDPRARKIGYEEFVQLCCDHIKIINWF